MDFDADTVTVNGSSGANTITFDSVPAGILAGAGDDTLIYSGRRQCGVGSLRRRRLAPIPCRSRTTGNLAAPRGRRCRRFHQYRSIRVRKYVRNNTATFDAAQFGAGKISLASTIIGDAGTQGLIINLARGESLDLSGLTFSGWTSGTDTIGINGSTDGETIVGTSQSDTIFTGGGGIDVLTGGGGLDTFVYTSADATL